MAAGSGLKGLGDLAFDGDGEAKKDFLPAALDIFLAKLVGRGTSSSLLSKLMSPNFLGLGGAGGGGLAARTAATAFCTAGLCCAYAFAIFTGDGVFTLTGEGPGASASIFLNFLCLCAFAL